ncbi:hypothetical protein JOC28_000339 [Streptococcus loxodontisalivarius]|uniref:Uncharacterized protein n=1 Tax=Streptococcus loxodontisalivarius TaxID=1349415 RepID=A0ABS2PPT9_9STRE|nr:hypothetical protein [Streptococcus loxodontisalivarius]
MVIKNHFKDSDQDGLSDMAELAYGTNVFSQDSDNDGRTDLEELQEGQSPLQKMIQSLKELQERDYETFIMALFEVELSVSSPVLLKQLYKDYMTDDRMILVNEELYEHSRQLQESVQEELSDLFARLYRTGAGNAFIMDTLNDQSLKKAMTGYDVFDGISYDKVALDTLEDMIQHDLSLVSQDYFSDLVYLALEKKLLDEKSEFLQVYVEQLLPILSNENQVTSDISMV